MRRKPTQGKRLLSWILLAGVASSFCGLGIGLAGAEPRHGFPFQEPDTPREAPTTRLGLDGCCPVTLLTQWRWVKGDEKISFQYDGMVFRFATFRMREQFLKAPQRYSPVHGGNDVVLSLEKGRLVAGHREHGVTFRDRVFLFGSEESLETFSSAPDKYAAFAGLK